LLDVAHAKKLCKAKSVTKMRGIESFTVICNPQSFCGERLSTNEGGGCSGPKGKEALRLTFCRADALSHSSTKFAVTIRVELAHSGVDVY
jgi:hypothetical protein